MGFLDLFQRKARSDRNRKLASLEQVEQRFESVDLNFRPLQAGHQATALKSLAVGAVITRPADNAVTRGKRRFFLKGIGAAAHIDVRARKPREFRLHLHLFSGRRRDFNFSNRDFRFADAPPKLCD
jgi:hypothetical protein